MSSAGIEELKQRLSDRKLVLLDGALGTELLQRGVPTKLPLWSASALLTAPDVVRTIHADYIDAGADIITTNTFRTSPRVLKLADPQLDCRTLTVTACDLALSAREQSGRPEVLVAGCMAPLEDCYQPERVPPNHELVAEHEEHAAALKAGGVDFLFLETMNCIREARAALTAATATGLPVAVSFVCSPNGTLLSGETIDEAVHAVRTSDPLFVATNCAPPDVINASVNALVRSTDLPIGVYANGEGHPADDNGWIFAGSGTPAEQYLRHAKEWREAGATVIGGCCGTRPEYIRLLKEQLS